MSFSQPETTAAVNHLSDPTLPEGAEFPSIDCSGDELGNGVTDPPELLSDVSDSPLTDEAREQAIKRAGKAMERAYFKFAKTGCFSDIGAAHHAFMLMKKLINGRSDEARRVSHGR